MIMVVLYQSIMIFPSYSYYSIATVLCQWIKLLKSTAVLIVILILIKFYYILII